MKGFLQSLKNAWHVLFGCDAKGCQNRATGFGLCDKHFQLELEKADEKLNKEAIFNARKRHRERNNLILKELSGWEEIVFTNEDEFLKRFAKSEDAWILTEVSWYSEGMRITYILHSGQHIGDKFPIKDWLDFLIKKGYDIKLEIIEF